MENKIKINFVILTLTSIIFLTASCSKSNTDKQHPNTSTFKISLSSLEESGVTFSSQKSKDLFTKGKTGESLEVLEVLEVLNENYKAVSLTEASKSDITTKLKGNRDIIDDLGKFKSNLFDIYNRSKGKLYYNKDAINIYDIDDEARFQCSSGTWNIWNSFLEIMPEAINSKNLVNIYTSGHILAGEVVNESGINILYGYESTVLGEGRVRFGDLSKLSIPMRIVDLKYDLLIQSLNGYIENTKDLRDEVLSKTASKYSIDLIKLEGLIGNDLADQNHQGEIRQTGMNQSIFGFGSSNVISGDKPILKTDRVSLSIYLDNENIQRRLWAARAPKDILVEYKAVASSIKDLNEAYFLALQSMTREAISRDKNKFDDFQFFHQDGDSYGWSYGEYSAAVVYENLNFPKKSMKETQVRFFHEIEFKKNSNRINTFPIYGEHTHTGIDEKMEPHVSALKEKCSESEVDLKVFQIKEIKEFVVYCDKESKNIFKIRYVFDDRVDVNPREISGTYENERFRFYMNP